jgi:hypothetical protein
MINTIQRIRNAFSWSGKRDWERTQEQEEKR